MVNISKSHWIPFDLERLTYDLKFSKGQILTLRSSGMCRCIVWETVAKVPEETTACRFKLDVKGGSLLLL
jgi:hypothetical protein